ncbi:Sodium/calcium exchanger membrane region [Penicillium malachiteum]|uniref:Sodium/calcium exchanger membrane region n=1 Tax=Penicillium malachiteum TaxID=1324776 RepID=A0AAD6MVU6_9EURO|nr:Sodium/calcium exchanger membrane region [Penicillium malachiteum]
MVRNDHLGTDEDIQPHSPFHDNSTCGDDSHLIDDCGSSIHSGNRSRAAQWGINQQNAVSNASGNISRHVQQFFHPNRSRRTSTISLPKTTCEYCDKPGAALKKQAKALITSKNLISVPFALITIFFSVSSISPLVIFIMNLIAIVPLSITLTLATEQLSHELGETAGALLNITIGNLAELIIFVTALMKNNIKVVQASLLGSILVNLLLVLGSAIIAGGLKSNDQTYNSDLTHAFIGLLNLTVSCLMIPSTFYWSVKDVKSADHMSLSFSRGVSVILLAIYFLYLFFQFKSHAHLFRSRPVGLKVTPLETHRPSRRPSYNEMFMDIESQSESESLIGKAAQAPEMQQIQSPGGPSSPPADIRPESGLPLSRIDTTERSIPRRQSWNAGEAESSDQVDDDEHHCKYTSLANRITAIVLLIAATVLIAICAEFFASSFGVLNEKGVLGESFVGLIVIPVAGNVAENVTAVIVAGKNQLDLAISVALGSAIQIGLLVAPVIVLVAWALDKPMTLHFDGFGMVTLIGSALLVSFLVLKGKTNYLEGAILCACFAAISVGAYLLPIT